VVPLDTFVLNTEAHPLPIIGSPLEMSHSSWYLKPPENVNSTIQTDAQSLKELLLEFEAAWN
jgi:hypothetical protein